MDPLVGGAPLELEAGVGEPAEGDGQPEVHGAVGEHGRERLPVGEPEAGQHGHQHELDHPQPTRGDRDGGQDVGQSVGGQEVDRGDEVAEGGHEDPQGRRVEQPVGRGPPPGPPEQGPVVHQDGEAPGQALDQRGEPVGVQEAHMSRDGPDDPAGPFLAPGEQVEQAPEGAEEDHADGRGHQHQDRRRGRGVTVEAGGHVEAVEDQEGHQREPEEHVEYHCRADALGAEGEPGVRPGDPGLGHEAVAQGRARGGPTGRDVAEGQGGQVDPEEAEPARSPGRQHGVGQLRVGGQGRHLEQHAEGQVGHVDVGQRAHFGAVAGHQRQGDVEDEEEDEQGAHADPHLAAHERAAVPPPVPLRGGRRFGLRSVCRGGLHRPHVGTARPLGPAMLRTWPTPTTPARWTRGNRRRS